MGSYSSSFDLLDEVTDLVFGGYRNGFDLTQLISHRFPLEEAVAAIEIASHPKADSMKIMIEPVPGGSRVGGSLMPGTVKDAIIRGRTTVEDVDRGWPCHGRDCGRAGRDYRRRRGPPWPEHR